MKNKIFVVIDKKNDVYVNSLISLSQDLAKQQTINTLKQQIYVFQNSQNIAQKANILSYLSTCQDFELHEICDGESELVVSYKELLKPYEKLLKITKEEVKKELNNDKQNNNN